MTSIYDIIDNLDRFTYQEKAALYLKMEEIVGNEFLRNMTEGNIGKTNEKFEHLDEIHDCDEESRSWSYHNILQESYGFEMDDNSYYSLADLNKVMGDIRKDRSERPLWAGLREFEGFIEMQIDMTTEQW